MSYTTLILIGLGLVALVWCLCRSCQSYDQSKIDQLAGRIADANDKLEQAVDATTPARKP